METEQKIVCEICDKTFSRLSNLNKHLRLLHGKEPESLRKSSLVCPVCFKLLTTYLDLRDHLITVHKVELFKEEKEFATFTEFEEWKESKEKEMKCLYVKTSGSKNMGNKKKSYYVCHRSVKPIRYMSTSEGVRQKCFKSQGSEKNAITCPSTLELVVKENFKVTLFIPHVGHKCSLTHLNLSKTERQHIAGKIAEGVTFEKILDDIRDGISDNSLDRLDILDRQDLRNIVRDFSLRGHVQLHNNDVISVQLWIERLRSTRDQLPILIYKPQGQTLDMFQGNDFVLIFMTEFQKKQLINFGSDKICIDSTHGTTSYDFQLTTLMVVDHFGEGVPTAFLLSNRVDTQVLAYFFDTIKTQVGKIKCTVFMSDDAPEYYNAWLKCMEVPENHLLCAWHVDRNWRKNLSKVLGNQELKAKVYKSVRTLLQIQNVEEFHELQDFLLSELLACKETQCFGEYFRTYYTSRSNLWAYCYRQGLGINTNMYLECMHKTLKHIYFQGKKNKRVDMCLQSLLKLVRDVMFKKIKRDIKGSNSFRIDLIKKAHFKSTTITTSDISNTKNDTWYVKSSKNNEEHYLVQKSTEECSRKNKDCQLICKTCQICVHEFSCTCLDCFVKGNLCKHIHAVVNNFFQSTKSQADDVNIEKKENSNQDILQDLVNHNSYNAKKSVNESLKTKLDVLYGLLSSKELSSETYSQVNKLLDKALDSVAKETNISLKSESNEPSNKKTEKQVRFVSTKKNKRKVAKSKESLNEPNSSEAKFFVEEKDKKMGHNDHSYEKKIGLFEQ